MAHLTNQETWTVDNATTRSYDGKVIRVEGGLFSMRVSETNRNGERRDGFIQILIEPYDLNAALSITKAEATPGDVKTIGKRK
jgi:hypothetical protein